MSVVESEPAFHSYSVTVVLWPTIPLAGLISDWYSRRI